MGDSMQPQPYRVARIKKRHQLAAQRLDRSTFCDYAQFWIARTRRPGRAVTQERLSSVTSDEKGNWMINWRWTGSKDYRVLLLPDRPRYSTTSLCFFKWKDCGSIRDRSFDELAQIVDEEVGHNIRDVRALRRNLAAELGIYVWTFDSCIHNGMAFMGEHHLRCNELRFRGGGHLNDQVNSHL